MVRKNTGEKKHFISFGLLACLCFTLFLLLDQVINRVLPIDFLVAAYPGFYVWGVFLLGALLLAGRIKLPKKQYWKACLFPSLAAALFLVPYWWVTRLGAFVSEHFSTGWYQALQVGKDVLLAMAYLFLFYASLRFIVSRDMRPSLRRFLLLLGCIAAAAMLATLLWQFFNPPFTGTTIIVHKPSVTLGNFTVYLDGGSVEFIRRCISLLGPLLLILPARNRQNGNSSA